MYLHSDYTSSILYPSYVYAVWVRCMYIVQLYNSRCMKTNGCRSCNTNNTASNSKYVSKSKDQVGSRVTLQEIKLFSYCSPVSSDVTIYRCVYVLTVYVKRRWIQVTHEYIWKVYSTLYTCEFGFLVALSHVLGSAAAA